MTKGNQKERNLAYQRAAYQSGSYTVNETAQLVTTGEKEADESKMAYDDVDDPVFYEDGYISLMPGEKKETGPEVREALLSGIKPELILEPFHN